MTDPMPHPLTPAAEMRAAFEHWARPQGFRLDVRDMAGSERLGQYCDDTTQAAWESWRECATTQAARIAALEGERDALISDLTDYMQAATAEAQFADEQKTRAEAAEAALAAIVQRTQCTSYGMGEDIAAIANDALNGHHLTPGARHAG